LQSSAKNTIQVSFPVFIVSLPVLKTACSFFSNHLVGYEYAKHLLLYISCKSTLPRDNYVVLTSLPGQESILLLT